MKPDAIFWIASMTKPVTAVSVMMLQDEGKFLLTIRSSKYVPELAESKTPEGKPANVTLKQLLTHTSGMALEVPTADREKSKTLADLMPVYAKLPMRFDPGGKMGVLPGRDQLVWDAWSRWSRANRFLSFFRIESSRHWE